MEFSSLPDYEAAVVLGKGTWFTWPAWIALKLISSGVVIVDVGGRLSAATRLIIHRLVLEKEHLFYLLLRLFYLTLLPRRSVRDDRICDVRSRKILWEPLLLALRRGVLGDQEKLPHVLGYMMMGCCEHL